MHTAHFDWFDCIRSWNSRNRAPTGTDQGCKREWLRDNGKVKCLPIYSPDKFHIPMLWFDSNAFPLQTVEIRYNEMETISALTPLSTSKRPQATIQNSRPFSTYPSHTRTHNVYTQGNHYFESKLSGKLGRHAPRVEINDADDTKSGSEMDASNSTRWGRPVLLLKWTWGARESAGNCVVTAKRPRLAWRVTTRLFMRWLRLEIMLI